MMNPHEKPNTYMIRTKYGSWHFSTEDEAKRWGEDWGFPCTLYYFPNKYFPSLVATHNPINGWEKLGDNSPKQFSVIYSSGGFVYAYNTDLMTEAIEWQARESGIIVDFVAPGGRIVNSGNWTMTYDEIHDLIENGDCLRVGDFCHTVTIMAYAEALALGEKIVINSSDEVVWMPEQPTYRSMSGPTVQEYVEGVRAGKMIASGTHRDNASFKVTSEVWREPSGVLTSITIKNGEIIAVYCISNGKMLYQKKQ